MPKSHFIILRVDLETKQRIEAAARARGLSVTTFVLEATEKVAGKAIPKPATSASRGVPAFFRALCQEATRGGGLSYRVAGYELTRRLPELIESATPKERERKSEEFTALAGPKKPRDEAKVLAWFNRELPRCMKLVPSRRFGQFVEGVYQAAEAGLPEWRANRATNL
jgi:hypothetical protein